MSDPPGARVTSSCEYVVWGLRIKLMSPGRTVSAPDSQATSPASCSVLFAYLFESLTMECD